ncbi:putative uncharacterized protein encoded by LINC00472 isoform X1 [Ailuropoda melanoleuca]|uniref:putative uncharacterized protein encoded by LINC00472 isoform X1 n=1 Tax=Ailuropoda melanoleuca TaxID=9646 RepID=UPI0014948B84|nr:putative uncharacterized protein encoded by LINC00472 isoform X1 [Ailuropoda melanoleuca]
MRPGSGPARLRVRAPALPRPLFDRRSPRPAPSRPAWPPPGEGAPPRSRSREGSPSAAAEPGNLRAGKSLRRLRGAARYGTARPWRPRSPPVTFWTRRQPGPRCGRRRLPGGPESVRGRPGLRVSWPLGRDGFKLSGALGFGERIRRVPLVLFGASGENKYKCDCLRVADMPLAREPYRWEPFRSRGY